MLRNRGWMWRKIQNRGDMGCGRVGTETCSPTAAVTEPHKLGGSTYCLTVPEAGSPNQGVREVGSS